MSDITRLDIGTRMSQAVVHGNTVYLAGQCGTAFAPIADQTREALHRIEDLLNRAGSDKTRLLTFTIWLADIADYDTVNAIWDAWISPGTAPARACCQAPLGGEGYGIEIICTAAQS
ncbi:RidA family protein [uncultured Tateyamaria sp.]|uniref:RidA family protein n=1 Tax=uncultured Tateyamaria sp. TaxID=455651 RepID=UPI002609900F|nr:RidA family protein [uncultured Tateyamaria sp.]